MIPILLEAIKAQNDIIADLQKQVTQLSNERSESKNSSNARTTGNDQIGSSSQMELFQNAPNPFDSHTEIRFSLSGSTKTATLYIYDLQGRQIKSINITERGTSAVRIESGELHAGTYLYTLIADGKEVGTKKMILTK